MKTIAKLSFLAALLLLSGCNSSSGDSSTSSDVAGGNSSSLNTNTNTSSNSSSSASPAQDEPAKTLTVNSVDDIKGYSFVTNTSSINAGDFSVEQSITLSIDCKGDFTYIEKTGSETKTASGNFVDISLDSIYVVGNYSNGDSMDEYYYKIVNHTLSASTTAGSCFYGYANDTQKGASCPNNLYLGSIVQDEVCN